PPNSPICPPSQIPSHSLQATSPAKPRRRHPMPRAPSVSRALQAPSPSLPPVPRAAKTPPLPRPPPPIRAQSPARSPTSPQSPPPPSPSNQILRKPSLTLSPSIFH